MLEFWREIFCCFRQQHFPGTSCLFQQDNARPHSAGVTTGGLRRHRWCVLDWPACSPDVSPIENVWLTHSFFNSEIINHYANRIYSFRALKLKVLSV